MTRKQAITKAIAALQQTGESTEVIRVLEELSSELPIIHWSDSALRDTIEITTPFIAPYFNNLLTF